MTKLPISTISFNTSAFLLNELQSLVKGDKIQSFMFVEHEPEEDTKKEHIHLVVVPASVVNPVAFRKLFFEPSFDGKKDLGCLPFKTSKLGDWLLYSVHYEPYLLSKGLVRQHSYKLEDVVTNEPFEYVEQVFNEARETLVNNRINSFLSMAVDGASFGELLAQGLVPPNHVVFYEKLYRQYVRVAFNKQF